MVDIVDILSHLITPQHLLVLGVFAVVLALIYGVSIVLAIRHWVATITSFIGWW